MGILNVTPDSFSDGGRFTSVASAVDHALGMAEEGADFIDIGGESTRPKGTAYGEGAEPVSVQEELDRVLPVVEALAGKLAVPISVDTYKAGVASRALTAGAAIINDISGFRFDPAMASTVAGAGATAVVMHIRGTPKTMQDRPVYGDLFGEIIASLSESVRIGREAGIRQMFVDPGIGFGKTAADNYRLIAGLARFDVLGCPVLIGPSRKSFLAAASGLGAQNRLEGSIAAAVAAALKGAHVIRVHDVRETRRALQVADAISGAEP
ncbi:MAG TPA: dihydropteroate synthase [Bacteroidota bacterium]|nr:dihydropteroate synthase [Bacteroidota bacterium]